jgi:hypothetical protein
MGDKERAKGSCKLAIKAYDDALRRDPLNARALEGRMRCGGAPPQPPPTR